MQQYKIVKGRVASPKCLFHIVTENEKDRYTLTEQSAHLVWLKLAFTILCERSTEPSFFFNNFRCVRFVTTNYTLS